LNYRLQIFKKHVLDMLNKHCSNNKRVHPAKNEPQQGISYLERERDWVREKEGVREKKRDGRVGQQAVG
jgi:hypothetical protein